MMRLRDALAMLVEIHTVDDELTGIVIKPDASPHPLRRADYFDAWLCVRAALERAEAEVLKPHQNV